MRSNKYSSIYMDVQVNPFYFRNYVRFNYPGGRVDTFRPEAVSILTYEPSELDEFGLIWVYTRNKVFSLRCRLHDYNVLNKLIFDNPGLCLYHIDFYGDRQ